MAVDQTEHVATPRASAPPAAHAAPSSSKGVRWGLPILLLVALVGVGVGVWYSGHATEPVKASSNTAAQTSNSEGASEGALLQTVEVVTPTAGGLTRMTSTPGTLMSFESAELYAKASGFLETQAVDIGDKVTKGQVLAVIFDPEAHKAVDLADAQLKHSKAMVETVRARIETAKAQIESAKAALVKANADVKHYVAALQYRHSELVRIVELVRRGSVEKKLEDEERERYASAEAAKEAADAMVLSAKAGVYSAEAGLQEAEADLDEAQALVAVNQAQLENAKILAAYTEIKSPYEGVITERNFFPGAFITSAVQGGNLIPLLAVARTDKLRVVVRVPDLKVPFVDVGDEAEIHIDALPNKVFHGTVARFSHAEDVGDRTMRTEIDLDNKEGKLRAGMYGNVTIRLEKPSKETMTIPAKAMIEQDGAGSGSVYVVQGGKVHKKDVTVGGDDGVDVEILSGLDASDQVVVNYNGSISEGLAVKAEQAKLEKPSESSES